MTYYVYHIINKNTGHIYIGRTRNPKQWDEHQYFLETNQHFSRLMQKHYNNGNDFEFKVLEQNDDPVYIAEKAIHLIEELDSTNPMRGYNSFFDAQGIGKRSAKLEVYDEDVLFFFLHNDKSKALKEFKLASNVFDYRIRRQGFGQGEDPLIPISTYECLYHFCAQEAVLSSTPISASSLMDRCLQVYDVSGRLRPTPHKITKHLKAFGVPQIKKAGLIYFSVNDN